jgi:hypothetical protein
MKTRQIPLAAALAAALLVAACGGGDDEAQTADVQAAEAAPIDPTTMLIDAEGRWHPITPQAAPANPAAHTRSGLYASRSEAALLEQALPGRVVRVDVECCDAQAIEFAVASAEVEQVTLSLPRSAPFIVSGADLRMAASVADQLTLDGATQVLLVTD